MNFQLPYINVYLYIMYYLFYFMLPKVIFINLILVYSKTCGANHKKNIL